MYALRRYRTESFQCGRKCVRQRKKRRTSECRPCVSPLSFHASTVPVSMLEVDGTGRCERPRVLNNKQCQHILHWYWSKLQRRWQTGMWNHHQHIYRYNISKIAVGWATLRANIIILNGEKRKGILLCTKSHISICLFFSNDNRICFVRNACVCRRRKRGKNWPSRNRSHILFASAKIKYTTERTHILLS